MLDLCQEGRDQISLTSTTVCSLERPRTVGVPRGKHGPYEKILRTCRPKLGKPLLFEVLLPDQSVVLIPNSKLRAEAPLMLCDFYEERISFPAPA